MHLSNSDEQRDAEPVILAGVAALLGVALEPRSLKLAGGARADVDGVAADESVFVEIFAHQGQLRGGQFHKVARDALKLITLGRARQPARLVIAFGDADAAACVTGTSWLAEALRTWSIEVVVIELDNEYETGSGRRKLGRSWSTLRAAPRSLTPEPLARCAGQRLRGQARNEGSRSPSLEVGSSVPLIGRSAPAAALPARARTRPRAASPARTAPAIVGRAGKMRARIAQKTCARRELR